MVPRGRALLLAIVVLIAGCTMSPGTDAGPTESTTPTETPPAVSPPGVSNGTLTDTDELLTAHTRSLRETGYRLAIGSGSRTVIAATSNFSSFRIAPDPETSKPAVWANETLTLAKHTRSGETTYRRPPRFWAGPGQLTAAGTLRTVFEAGRYRQTNTTQCGGRWCAVLTATGSERFGNFTARADIDARGIVHRFRATFERETQHGSSEQSVSVIVSRLGNVTVDRPQWVDAWAANASESGGGDR